MATPVEDTRTARQLTARMSLRTPQGEALATLAELLQQVRLSQDPDLAHWLRIVQAQHPGVSAFELKPVLGIELTATPKTTGVHPRPLKNVVYHYPLARALADGFVKIPYVATRRDFRAEGMPAAELERIKLEDGIHHHEYVKVELQTYALQQGAATVKPFMLVVAQDTAHAGSIKAQLESSDFFDGRYKGRVIEVHSNLSGEESDESMHRLLAVEHDEATEVVIHVNKLKEGWDVTNLYTIVPLRASASEILTEQTIGRGLRLPYGRRTGVLAMDRLTIIAHDRFQEIIDRANLGDSIIRDVVVIGDGPCADVPTARPQILIAPSRAEMLCTGRTALLDDAPLKAGPNDAPASIQERAGRWAVESASEQHVRLAKAAW